MSVSSPSENPTSGTIAYLCMEYGIHHTFPIYSGGLGVLAGDIVKAAHDQKRDFVAVGIFWGEGYTIQTVGADGELVDTWVPTTREHVEATNIKVEVTIRGVAMEVTAYRVVGLGTCPLFLLEPVDPANRWVSKRLYGGGDDDRVAQEVLLGVGGVRFLDAWFAREGGGVGLYHFNEGHALFAAHELIAQEMCGGASFEEACGLVRERVVFTTHTPVPAGNEVHPVERLLREGADVGTLSREQLVAIGGEPFEMTPAALRLSRAANGVAELHGETARKMWREVEGGAEIRSITNGVHMGTWQDEEVAAASSEGDLERLGRRHGELKLELIEEVEQLTGRRLDESRLLIGFARRAATYKRAALIFRELEWLEPLLVERKVQLIFSGKAHPRDAGGKAVVKRLLEMAARYPDSVIFLQNYEMRLGGLLTRGCDVWLNNPIRPREASGTSGMKAAANGVLNLSILDGWWAEGCEHGVNGWQFGDGYEGEGADEHDLAALQGVLSEEVIPTFYDAPVRWREMMVASIEGSRERFSAGRMVSRYFGELYC